MSIHIFDFYIFIFLKLFFKFIISCNESRHIVQKTSFQKPFRAILRVLLSQYIFFILKAHWYI